jgi:hypothetical protein
MFGFTMSLVEPRCATIILTKLWCEHDFIKFTVIPNMKIVGRGGAKGQLKLFGLLGVSLE